MAFEHNPKQQPGNQWSKFHQSQTYSLKQILIELTILLSQLQ